jgi:hypothetical protein
MATTKVINDLIDLNQSGSTNALKGCAGTTAQQPTSSFDIDYLIVGGGGTASGSGSGGGGAGGLVTGTKSIASGVSQTIQIGSGGIADTTLTNQQPNGDDSGFAGIRAVGGGSGQRRANGSPGGSGAGAGINSNSTAYVGGSGITGQGNDGGNTNTSYQFVGAGGGGSGNPLADTNGVGASSSANQGGNGGSGTNMTSFISVTDATSAVVGEIVGGTNVFFAGGGGGGGSQFNFGGITGGSGGSGGGGAGSQTDGTRGTNGTANTGGGGGAGVTDNTDATGGDGGSGVVILKYDNTVVNSVTVDGTLVAPTTTTTTSNCNYPTTGSLLYQFEDNLTDTCGLQNASLTTGSETYGTGKFGKAFDFDGSTYLGINSALPFSSSFSISFWVYPHNLTSGGSSGFQRLYAGSGYGGGTGISLYLLYNYIDIYADPGGTRLFYQGTLVENVWQHIVLTRTYNTQWELYLNGSSLATYSSAQLTTDFSGTAQTLGGGTYYYDGLMDQFRVFASALSASEVTDLYNEVGAPTKFTNGTTDTIVFKEGSGNITFNKADAEPGAEIGMLRCNTTLGQMEHYTATGYKDFTNL